MIGTTTTLKEIIDNYKDRIMTERLVVTLQSDIIGEPELKCFSILSITPSGVMIHQFEEGYAAQVYPTPVFTVVKENGLGEAMKGLKAAEKIKDLLKIHQLKARTTTEPIHDDNSK